MIQRKEYDTMKVIVAKNQEELFSLMLIRMEVFMMEQQVSPDIEIDEYDKEAIHFLFYNDDNVPCACCRLLFVDGHYKIGRLAVLKNQRRKGYAAALLKEVEAYAKKQEIDELYLNAQTSARVLYEKLGYVAYGDIFFEANIEHIGMKKPI